MKKYIYILIVSFTAVLVIIYSTQLKYYEPHRFLEYFGVLKNDLEINIVEHSNNHLCDQLDVFWVGEKENLTRNDEKQGYRYDTLHIYGSHRMIHEIPSSYGKNGLVVKNCDQLFSKVGFYNFKEWYKYDYQLDINIYEDSLAVSWDISNIYTSFKGEGSVTHSKPPAHIFE